VQHRAWSTLDIKAVDREHRLIEGIASTPTIDRSGDSMDPAGAQFTLPMPFLWFHDAQSPIGEVIAADVRPDGIHIKARVSTVTKPGRLKTLVDDAWAAFTADPPLVRGLSIGWNELESTAIKGTRFKRVLRWLWGELSAVTIPMNTDATILAVKSADLAAMGLDTLRDGSTTTTERGKAARIMTIQEQITAFETKRAASLAGAMEIQNKVVGEGRSKDDAEREKYDELSLEVKSCDRELADLRDMEKLNLVQATPITDAPDQTKASLLRGGMPTITVKPNVPKGTAFARMCMAMAAGHGDSYQTLQEAKRWHDSTPEVEEMVKHMWSTKAAVAVGTTTDSTWAGPLVVTQPLNEFLEMLRPRTLLGRIPGLRYVPFNVSVPTQTTGGGPEQAEAGDEGRLLDGVGQLRKGGWHHRAVRRVGPSLDAERGSVGP
jgi:hypothetical protein